MKIFFLSVIAITSVFNNSIDPITDALKTGDIDQLSVYFDNQIEMTVIDEPAIYDKQTAKKKLASFFTDNQPTTFEQLHKGISEGQQSSFFIGDLHTPTASYRVYLYLHERNVKSFIQELRIEEE